MRVIDLFVKKLASPVDFSRRRSLIQTKFAGGLSRAVSIPE
jgi:hypothetical protein